MDDERNPNGERGDESTPPDQRTPTWKLTETTPKLFRNCAWRLLGQSRKRDVFLAVRDLAETPRPLEKAEIASRAVTFPHFDDDAEPDLGDNGDLLPLKHLLAVVAVPRMKRPSHEYVVPFEPMCRYLVNPFHAPTDRRVATAIDYLVTNWGRHGATPSQEETDKMPIDPFSAEAYTYVRLSEHLSGVDPKVRLDAFCPNDFGAQNALGFEIRGTLIADSLELEPGVSDSLLKTTLGTVFTEFAEHAARNKEIFRIGLYEQKEDESERDVRRRAIEDNATFETFDPDVDRGVVEFEWVLHPSIV